MKAFGIVGLALVLFLVLVLGPFARSFTEGFADSTTPPLNKDSKDKTTSAITDAVPSPSEVKQPFEDYEEEFEGVISADLEKNTKQHNLLFNPGQKID